MEKETGRRPTWKVDVYWGIRATTGKFIMVNRNGVWLTRKVQRKTARERWERSNLEVIMAVPRRQNEDFGKMEGEQLK